jgi:hypothetical protein
LCDESATWSDEKFKAWEVDHKGEVASQNAASVRKSKARELEEHRAKVAELEKELKESSTRF